MTIYFFKNRNILSIYDLSYISTDLLNINSLVHDPDSFIMFHTPSHALVRHHLYNYRVITKRLDDIRRYSN